MVKVTQELFTSESLYYAYRKAKVDVFFERSQPLTEAFCEYEKSLHDNLVALRQTLLAKEPGWPNELGFIGEFGCIPKGLTVSSGRDSRDELHFCFSDLSEEWDRLVNGGTHTLTVEFRPVAHFTVNMYVVCALWINLIGHKYDACLDASARGSRLRRLRSEHSTNMKGDYHTHAPGSFEPYFYCYRSWREQGLRAIRHELKEGRRVVALTMDLTSFYHNVDPAFLLDARFLKQSRFADANNGATLTRAERRFTKQLVTAFSTWASHLPHSNGDSSIGVPVGPSAPRVIANVLLAEFDRLVQEKLSPVYYGRYVDDVFLVLRDSGTYTSAERVVELIAQQIDPLKFDSSTKSLSLRLPYAAKSHLQFKATKQRVFILSGEIGEDLLDAIENKIDEVSSEWRMLPNLDDLERSPAARVLTATKTSTDEADALRKADELSLRRLGFSLLLRSMNALVRDLPANYWTKERQRFYRFVSRHVLTPLRILDLNDYLPRLVGIAVACEDWGQAASIVKQIRRTVDKLKQHVLVEPASNVDRQWDGYMRHLKKALLQAVVSSFPVEAGRGDANAAERVVSAINDFSPDVADLFVDKLDTRARDMFLSDLAQVPLKDFLFDDRHFPAGATAFDVSRLPDAQKKRSDAILDFLEQANLNDMPLCALLFPTRPLSAPDITELVPSSVRSLEMLRRYVHALRGTWVRPTVTDEDTGEGEYITIGVQRDDDSASGIN